ncbi:uncharacterized protein TRIADDRAFT_54881 [Trichoplax adhaerens]|uniref:Integrin beta n=1 Tax=Trichoplax adhaerens TaxID=10228 RepID=B3RT92_TRIAD|nr:hypothetical protein TRIADDRAFT_54881 [Trichoplax adhaerens]EDV27186.1 hypothetical protein TRIADDRAFT_54881 [Trichoplax adhaerens]|eukprot:XP_002111182.1 hypothetical protein TRIADDRAFT_54881 [Trichoplax adhaerens]
MDLLFRMNNCGILVTSDCRLDRFVMMIAINVRVFLILAYLLVVAVIDPPNPCQPLKACEVCIANPECAWCADFKYEGENLYRCDAADNHEVQGCEDIVNPQSSLVNRTDVDDDLDSILLNNFTDSVLQLPRFNVKLRTGQPVQISFNIVSTQRSPVDMYFLYDISRSMYGDLDMLKKRAITLALEMKKLSRDTRWGFGTFVDKFVSPFRLQAKEKLVNPCNDGEKEPLQCIRPYSFRNNLSLTNNMTSFQEVVNAQMVSSNLDAPESGLDALLQLSVCNEIINWRPYARHIVVYASDADFHYAGDGKLAGLVIPNDAKCHLSEHGEHETETVMDYPSIGQLKEKLRENRIIPVFLIRNRYQSYGAFAELLDNLQGVMGWLGHLEAESSNILGLINSSYDAVSTTIELYNDPTDLLKFEYFSNCTKINVHVVGVGDLVVEIEHLCRCGCTRNTTVSEKCSYNGTLRCGQCNCNRGRSGDFCECDASLSNTVRDCDVTDNSTCNYRGHCVCQQCQCNQDDRGLIYGKYCQCDNFTCPADRNGNLCSGHGRCDCGTCKCNHGWTGIDCGCTLSIAQCIDPKSRKICNGKGNCNCGTCDCHPKSGYNGKTCQSCLFCPTACDVHGQCLSCWLHKQPVCSDYCNNITITNVTELDTRDEWYCYVQDINSSCYFKFIIEGETNRNLLTSVSCPVFISQSVLIVSIMVNIVGFGLLCLIAWKIAVTIKDKIDYQKFTKKIWVNASIQVQLSNFPVMLLQIEDRNKKV